MIELTHNSKRYMVDGGQWFRRLGVGEVIPEGSEVCTEMLPEWRNSYQASLPAPNNPQWQYRVPCTDPRPPFTVGQLVKVSRKDEIWDDWVDELGERLGQTGVFGGPTPFDSFYVEFEGDTWAFPPWCLDAVEAVSTESEYERHSSMPVKKIGKIVGKFVPAEESITDQSQLNGEPCLTWILAKLAKQPAKTDKKLEIIQRAMSELVKLEAENNVK